MSFVQDPLIEHAVYEQMALVSSAFAFSRSQWNAQCGQEHLVLQVQAHTHQWHSHNYYKSPYDIIDSFAHSLIHTLYEDFQNSLLLSVES